MYKELAISIITVIVIIILNSITENYTNESVHILTEELLGLRNEITEENIGNEEIKNKIDNIYNNWSSRYNVLAYYVEHDELEKVETNLVLLTSAIDAEEYSDAIGKLNEDVFILRHIQEKNSFDFKNIF